MNKAAVPLVSVMINPLLVNMSLFQNINIRHVATFEDADRYDLYLMFFNGPAPNIKFLMMPNRNTAF